VTDIAIDVRGLDKSFGKKPVLQQLSLQVHRGELVGLVGPNGAGKSTLLRTLVGLVRATAGTVSVLGLDPATASLPIRRRCCYLPGETSVYQEMTGQQFLDFALSFHPARQPDVEQRLLELFGLPLQQKVRSYSAGMKQKLAVLATLAPDVEIYILDEPDRALDATVRFALRPVLLYLKARGKTLLLSSHHLSEVETLADRMEFLVDGRIVDAAAVAAARQRLARHLRLRLVPGTPLPDGARVLATEPDGTLQLEVDEPPMRFLQRLPPDAVLAAELGVVRLEELYQLLLSPATEVAP
jgi:ABC-2 type transport system ATP-binding protein